MIVQLRAIIEPSVSDPIRPVTIQIPVAAYRFGPVVGSAGLVASKRSINQSINGCDAASQFAER
jgi:hypothetical protein